MKHSFRLALILGFALSLVAAALASSPVGTWTGRIVVDTSKMTPPKDPQTQSAIRQQIQMAQKIMITITFKADKTFTAKSTGAPRPPKTQTGTWSQSGNTVILTPTQASPSGKPLSQSFTMSKNGKTLTSTLPGAQMNIVTKIVFSR